MKKKYYLVSFTCKGLEKNPDFNASCLRPLERLDIPMTNIVSAKDPKEAYKKTVMEIHERQKNDEKYWFVYPLNDIKLIE